MEHDQMRARLADARVGRLATVGPDGRPHLVPFVFALEGDTLYTSVDRKPKRTKRLQRLRNIERDPRVAVLVDEYRDEWPELWWVRADGRARVVDGGAESGRARTALGNKYEQYRDDPLTDEIVVAIDIERLVGWAWRD